MCGIAGLVVSNPLGADLTSVLDSLAHRGPDGSGQYRSDRVWLGHTRLSIIDTSQAAAQPMRVEPLGTLVYNGELYDFAHHRGRLEQAGQTFRTRSDTEVVLRGLASE